MYYIQCVPLNKDKNESINENRNEKENGNENKNENENENENKNENYIFFNKDIHANLYVHIRH